MKLVIAVSFILGTSCIHRSSIPIEEPPFEVTMSLKHLSDETLQNRLKECENKIKLAQIDIKNGEESTYGKIYYLAVKTALLNEVKNREEYDLVFGKKDDK